MLALLYCWSITPLFGNGGVGDQERKAVKIVIYPFGAHLLPIHIETDLLQEIVIGKQCCNPFRTVWLAPVGFIFSAPRGSFLKKDHKYRF